MAPQQKFKGRKVRMDGARGADDARGMDDDTRCELMDEAERLALEAFGEHAECEHIEAVFERLALHWRWGLPADGAVTVH
jgi:hypothetical protein